LIYPSGIFDGLRLSLPLLTQQGYASDIKDTVFAEKAGNFYFFEEIFFGHETIEHFVRPAQPDSIRPNVRLFPITQ